MKHANRSQPSDCPGDFAYGKYWNRHRELDNLLSGAFMFLPERFRLPQNVREPVAIHTNLNLHAAVICLHNSAYEMANEHNLPDHLKSTIKTRLLSASNEVVNILKLTSHTNAGYVSFSSMAFHKFDPKLMYASSRGALSSLWPSMLPALSIHRWHKKKG